MTKWLIASAFAALVVIVLQRRKGELGRRFRLAMKIALFSYAAIFAVRLVLFPPRDAELQGLAIVAAAFGLIWLSIRLLALRRRGKHSSA